MRQGKEQCCVMRVGKNNTLFLKQKNTDVYLSNFMFQTTLNDPEFLLHLSFSLFYSYFFYWHNWLLSSRLKPAIKCLRTVKPEAEPPKCKKTNAVY